MGGVREFRLKFRFIWLVLLTLDVPMTSFRLRQVELMASSSARLLREAAELALRGFPLSFLLCCVSFPNELLESAKLLSIPEKIAAPVSFGFLN